MFNRFQLSSRAGDRWHRIAIIDLGSNTARLVVMSMQRRYAYRLEDEVREVVRLHEGMSDAGLSDTAGDRAFHTLKLFKRLCDSLKVDTVIPTASSAVRVAANSGELLARVKRETGWTLRVISEEREAYYGAIGALNEVPLENGYVVDIGGGSIQISQVRDCRYSRGASLPLGALALTERFVHSDPIRRLELAALQEHAREQIRTVSWVEPHSGWRLVGLGGTIRNLAKIESRRQDYPLRTLHGFCLTRRSIGKSIEHFRKNSLSERAAIPGLSADRADIMLAGAVVIAEIMDRVGCDALTISENGVREGLFFEQFWAGQAEPVANDIRLFSVLNLARIYRVNQSHSEHIKFLINRLYGLLAPLHSLSPPDLDLLEAAAYLHDVGIIISHRDHDATSQMIVINSGIPGYSPREIALLGLLVRYHLKGTPTLDSYARLTKKGDDDRLTKLVALLRTAEYLDRGRNAAVRDISAEWNSLEIRFRLFGESVPEVEIWDTQRNALPLMERVFRRKVRLEYAGRAQ